MANANDVYDRIQQAFDLEALEAQWEAIVDDWRQEVPGEEERALQWIHQLRAELIETADTIDDPLELQETMAMRYIKYKSTWIMLNTKLQYQMLRHGTPDQDDLHRASLVSTLIGALEHVINNGDVREIETFLADPIQGSRAA
jgi:predicted lipoprotein